MPQEFHGDPAAAADARIALVVSRYNDFVTLRLYEGALAALRENGVEEESIETAFVPGAWELSLVAQRFAEAGGFDAVIVLGAVIRGETTHDQYINQQVSHSLGQLALRTGIPVLFGLLTCNTVDQAINRAGGSVGNKGTECALAALEMISLLRQMPRPL